jgi:hypothetical protein
MEKIKDSALSWRRFYNKNSYYHKDLESLARNLIPADTSVLEIGSRGGEILRALPNKLKVGVDWDSNLLDLARNKIKSARFTSLSRFPKDLTGKKFDYILVSHAFSEIEDVQKHIRILKKFCHPETRVAVVSFNFLWKPILDLAEALGLKNPSRKEPNWLTEIDIDNLFFLESFEKIKSGKRFLFPYDIPFVSILVNKILSQLPFFNLFCLTKYSIYSPVPPQNDYSVSVVIPARNEEGHIPGILKKIPRLGKSTEVIFVESFSRDNTYSAIKSEIASYKGPHKVKLLKSVKEGKGNAVRLGFSKAINELLMIQDSDLTVDPKDLKKFYHAIASGKGDLVIGSRLVYPMEKQAMRVANYIGNKFFSLAFTFLLGQPIKDTLCGTKAILKENYNKIEKNRKIFGDFDPYGDFDLLFGSSKLNLKIIEIPVRYKERIYGKTNISRWKHGIILLGMVLFAARKLKFI